MQLDKLIHSLDRFRNVLPAMVNDLDEDLIRWKPASGNWSILEIVCHLADEEAEDFRPRVKMTLEDSSQGWPPIEPEQWAVDRNYNEASLSDNLNRFLKERSISVQWLRNLESPDWTSTYQHPNLGPIQAGEVMAAWAAHDHLHARQIAKRLFEHGTLASRPFSNRYAGNW